MRRRPSSRLLVLNQSSDVLLFRFVHKSGALAGQDFWATPGGGLEPGETFVEAAVRELKEETGIDNADIGGPIAERQFVMQLPDGEHVLAEEQFFVVRPKKQKVSRAGLTAPELEVIADFKWWTETDLRSTSATVWPNDLSDMLYVAGYWS